MGQENIRKVSVVGSTDIGGELVFFDGFEDLFSWISSADGDGAATKDTATALTGDASMKMLSDSGSPSDGQNVQATRRAFVIPGATYDIQFDFRLLDVSDFKSIEFYINYFGNTTQFVMGIKYLPPTDAWQYRSTTAAWASISGFSQTIPDTFWNRLRLGIDLNTGTYIDLYVNDNTADLSTLTSTGTASSGGARANYFFQALTEGANQFQANIDNFLIEQRT